MPLRSDPYSGFVFPGRYENLVAPQLHEDKMEWIRSSYNTFFARVREFDSLKRRGEYN